MNWGAHKADVRIAAKNSVTMRAALRASINAQTIYEAYLETHPFVTENNTQDRTRARAWAMLHVKINPEPIKAALIKIYADGFLLGLDASKEAIGQAEKQYQKSAEITKVDDSDYVDWNNWKPGNRAAALLYRPTGAFEKLLSDAGITSKKIAANGYDRIGTALADSIAAGFSPARAAKVITEKIGDPARALTIAITEQNRAMSLASMENYKNYGLEKIEWSGANPCDICAPNEGQVVTLGEPFNSGDTEPPVHPNCRCAVLPVIDEAFYAEPNTSGMDLISTPEQDSADTPREEDMTSWQAETEKPARVLSDLEIKKMNQIARDDVKPLLTTEELIGVRTYKGSDYDRINRYLREGDMSFGRVTATDPVKLQEKLKEITPVINGTNAAINKAPGLTEPLLVYRGVQADFGDALWKSGVGSEYLDKGFTSTSFDRAITGDFGSTRLEITLPVGTKGLALDGIVPRGEAEFLLATGTKFRITGYDANPKDARSQYSRVIKVEVIR